MKIADGDTKFQREINIKTRDDFENYLWEELGNIDMENVRRIIDLHHKYKHLLWRK